MANHYLITSEKIVDEDTGAMLQEWGIPRDLGGAVLMYRPFPEAAPIGIDAKRLTASAENFEAGRGLEGFIFPKSVLNYKLNKAKKLSHAAHEAVFSYEYVINMLSKFQEAKRPKNPKYNIKYIVCDTDVLLYNNLPELIVTSIDEIKSGNSLKLVADI